jgi:hypothetical protein
MNPPISLCGSHAKGKSGLGARLPVDEDGIVGVALSWRRQNRPRAFIAY